MSDIIPDEIENNLVAMNIPIPQPIELPAESFVFADGLPLKDLKPSTGNPKDLIGDTKPDLSLVPPAASLYLAAAFTDGAKKYGPYNWRENAVKNRVYIAAALRHINQYLDGEDIDPTSGRPHVGHALACLAIIADAKETGNLIDDRPLPGAAGRMIRA